MPDGRRNNGGARPNSGPKKRPDPWAMTKEDRVDLTAYCKAMGYDPVVRMIEMVEKGGMKPALELAIHREIARYVHPTMTRATVKHSGSIGADLRDKTTEELEKLRDALAKRRRKK